MWTTTTVTTTPLLSRLAPRASPAATAAATTATTAAMRNVGHASALASSLTARATCARALSLATSRALTTNATPPPPTPDRRYHWIDAEAQRLVAQAYQLHQPDRPFPPSRGMDRSELSKLSTVPHYAPRTLPDHIALYSTWVLEKFMSLFFRKEYVHHAVTLETVASVPGFVAAMHRHMRSLRRMKRDHGWIDPLLEEALNERMHLLIFMQHCKPTVLERAFVLFAQGTYVSFYGLAYLISPATAHRAVGYLEEAAQRAYNELLHSIDAGDIPNTPLPENSIAAKFYRLPPNSTFRDVVLHVRADEVYHGIYNHSLANQAKQEGGLDVAPVSVEEDILRYDRAVGGPLARAADDVAHAQRKDPNAAFEHGRAENKI